MLFDKLEELERRIKEAYELIAQLKYDKMELEIKCKELEQKYNENAVELDVLRSERDKLGSRIEGILDQFNGLKNEDNYKEPIRMIEPLPERPEPGETDVKGRGAPAEATVERNELEEKQEAIREEPVEEDEDNFVAHFERGLEYERKGIFEEAIEAYQKAIKLNPNYISAIEHLAFLLEKLNREKEALPLWERVLALKK